MSNSFKRPIKGREHAFRRWQQPSGPACSSFFSSSSPSSLPAPPPHHPASMALTISQCHSFTPLPETVRKMFPCESDQKIYLHAQTMSSNPQPMVCDSHPGHICDWELHGSPLNRTCNLLHAGQLCNWESQSMRAPITSRPDVQLPVAGCNLYKG